MFFFVSLWCKQISLCHYQCTWETWDLERNKQQEYVISCSVMNFKRLSLTKTIYTGWWFQTCFIFHHIWDVILPIDELIFFKMVIAPPTRYPSMRMRMSQPFYSHQAWKTGWRVSNHNTRSPPWDWCGKPNNKPCHYVTNHHWRSFYIIPFFGVYPIINQSRLGMVYLSHNLPWLSHYSPISIHILLWISYMPLLLAFPD